MACTLEKEKAKHRDQVLEKFYYIYFFNIVLMWKIMGASKASVLYVYIDDNNNNNKKQN